MYLTSCWFILIQLPHQWSIVNHQICSTVATGLLLRPKSLPGNIGDNKLQTSFFFPVFFFGEALTCIWTLPCAPCIYGISHNSTNEICSGIGISLRFHECCIRDRSTVVCSCPLQLRSCYTHVPWSREFCFERLDRNSLVRILCKLVLSGEASWRCLRRALGKHLFFHNANWFYSVWPELSFCSVLLKEVLLF